MSGTAFLSLGYAFQHVLVSVIVALVIVLFLSVKAIGAEARARVLLVALMLCVVAPLLPIPQFGGAEASAVAGANAIADTNTVSGERSSDLRSAYADVADVMPLAPDHIEMSEPLAILIVVLWFAGAVFQLGRHVKGHLSLRRIVAASARASAMENHYREILPRGVELRLSDSFGPAVVGVFRPKILIPEQLASCLPEDALRAVLLHEASHVRRHDLLAYACQKCAEAVFWWNPVIRWIGTTLDSAREIACDVKASRSCETSADYAEALLTAVEHIAIPGEARFASALSVSDSLQALDRRIDSLIEERGTGVVARVATTAATLALVASCVAACAMSRPLMPVPARVAENVSVAPIAPTAPIAVDRPSAASEDAAPRVAAVAAAPPAAAPPARLAAKDERMPATPRRPDFAAIEAEYEQYTAGVRARHREYTAAMEAKNREYTTASAAKHRQYTEAAEAKHREYTQSAEARHRAYTEAMEAKNRQLAAAGENRGELARDLEAERREYIADAERERREHTGAMERERREYTADAERERRGHSAAMEQARREQEQAMNAAKAEYERKIEELKRTREQGFQ